MIVDGGPVGPTRYLIVNSVEKWIKFSTDPDGNEGVQMDFP